MLLLFFYPLLLACSPEITEKQSPPTAWDSGYLEVRLTGLLTSSFQLHLSNKTAVSGCPLGVLLTLLWAPRPVNKHTLWADPKLGVGTRAPDMALAHPGLTI